MRIWSIHPKYLDTKGLVALWRETLLAKKVLQNETKGYKNHPQLYRFKQLDSPLDAINYYLKEVYNEASKRGYNFDFNKIDEYSKVEKIPLTQGQLAYERVHLLSKLKIRDSIKYKEVNQIKIFDEHPLFYLVPGKVESWEKII